MLPFLQNLLWDQAAFQRYGRAALLVGGQLVDKGVIPTGVGGAGHYVGPILMFLWLMIGAGTTTNGTPK